ncbi:MAG: winged helix-turn-helix domain-containing protein [Candidatus Methylomirabilota bacterium]
MLERLFSSKTRVDILRLFFTRSGAKLYVRQIARDLHRDISGIKRELDNLERLSLLISEKVGNLRYYSVNKDAAIYPEIKGLIDKTVGLPGTLATSLRGLPGLQQAWLYSSNAHAPGEGAGAIPVLIVGRVDLAALNERITRIEGDLSREVNYTVFDEGEFERRRSESDPFVIEVLGRRSIQLIGRDDGV